MSEVNVQYSNGRDSRRPTIELVIVTLVKIPVDKDDSKVNTNYV